MPRDELLEKLLQSHGITGPSDETHPDDGDLRTAAAREFVAAIRSQNAKAVAESFKTMLDALDVDDSSPTDKEE
ncbi:hypothetical protein [Anaeromyxobacter oryzae]|uniref:Uncharacterized protein n=1 Tax=Anaeromyxobacter oryzae TaxID=2918170 RepID=A0ABN6MXG1_9BACT|nr:hypothetical protein [Anaeromyxobacter oryzae]BDG04945.1 hypothetical protein AMOR_39410 [Anaeromyxobacter oryzae]